MLRELIEQKAIVRLRKLYPKLSNEKIEEMTEHLTTLIVETGKEGRGKKWLMEQIDKAKKHREKRG